MRVLGEGKESLMFCKITGRWMVRRSSTRSCGFPADRRSSFMSKEKRLLAPSRETGFLLKMSVHRKDSASTSSVDKDLPTSSRAFWKSISCQLKKMFYMSSFYRVKSLQTLEDFFFVPFRGKLAGVLWISLLLHETNMP